ncbi:hypothetical protein TNCV_2862691 [Trichonephila clavipes]|nr:hypothetical protein TNCV_2862691 [Trichonephila clavipes]
MRSSKEELVKKDVLMSDGSDKDQDSVRPSVLSSSQNHAMPVKNNVFLFSSGLDEKGKKEYVPLRTAYSQAGRCGMQPKAKHSLRAQAQQIQTKTIGLLREEKKERCASRRYRHRIMQTYLLE